MAKIGRTGVRDALAASLLILAIALLYFSFLPVSYSFDGTVFSHMLRYALARGDVLAVTQFHHLAYFPLSYALYRSLQALGRYQVLEFFHLQMISLFFAAAALVLIERLLKKLKVDLALRLAGVALVAFSHAFWLYAVDAEVHLPGFFFTAAGMFLLLAGGARFRALAGAALCLVAAAAFHLTNVLPFAAALLFLLVQRLSWKRILAFVAVYAAAALSLFGGYSLLAGKPLLQILHAGASGIDPYSGYAHAFARPLSGASLLSSLASLKTALAAGGGWAPWVAAAALAGLLLLAGGRGGDPVLRPARRLFLLWALACFLFFTWWEPANIEFKIQAVVPLILAAVCALSRLRSPAVPALAALLAASLLGLNLARGIGPQSEAGRNVDHQTAAAIGRATPAAAQVLISGRFSGYGYGKIYIPYFAGRQVVILDWLLGRGRSLADIVSELARRDAAGIPIFALDEIAVPGAALSDLLDFHGVSAGDRSRFAARCRFVPLAPLPGGRRLYRVVFAAP